MMKTLFNVPWENAKKCADVVKLAGYNYAEGYYKEHHAKGTELYAGWNTWSVY